VEFVGLAVLVALIVIGAIGLYYLYVGLIWAGVNAAAFLDNALAVWPASGPLPAWMALGAAIGLAVGLWRAGTRHRIGYLKPLAPLLPALLLGGAAAVTRPLDFDAVHPFVLEQQAQEARQSAARAAWEREHARTVKVARANVRQSPSTQADVLASLPRDTRVFVEATAGSWALIQFPAAGGRLARGYIHGDLIERAVDRRPGSSRRHP